MSFTFGSLSSEIKTPCFDGLRSKDRNSILCKPSIRIEIEKFNRHEPIRVLNHEAREVVISSEIIPGCLEGSVVGNRRLEEPERKLDFVRTLLIDNYDSYTYNIYQELSVVNGVPPVVVRNNECRWEELFYYLYQENAFDNIVISPGPGSPSCPADIGICLELLLECRDIPILGVCLGHQALGYAHGAQVVHASEPVHGRLSEIEHTGCRLFDNIPSGHNSGFKVVRYHSLVIDPKSLPKELLPIAWTSSTDTLSFLGSRASDSSPNGYKSQIFYEVSPTADFEKSENGTLWPSRESEEKRSVKVLMGIKHSTRPHYGLQFHPESVATCHGRQIFKNFRMITEDYWLRMRHPSKTPTEKKLYNHACMQVPQASLHINRQLANKFNKENIPRLRDAGNQLRSSNDAKFLKLKWRKLERIASRIGGAGNIFCELFGNEKAADTFWLDSSSTEKGRARFSFMGGKSGSLWKQVSFRLSDQSGKSNEIGGYLLVEDAQGNTSSTYLEDGFFNFLNKELESFCYDERDFEELPFDFHGGYVGYIGYELKVECGMPANHHVSKTPDACLFFSDSFIAIDHHTDDVYIVSLQEKSTTNRDWLDLVEKKLLNLQTFTRKKLTQPQNQHPVPNASSEKGFVNEKSRDCYIKDVKKCQKFIKDGESYELCLTTKMRKSVGEMDSLGLYLKLREKNPAPYAAWFNFSNEDLTICCSSPERFLRLDRNGNLEAKPIKGTIGRGPTDEEDEVLKNQLQNSIKDRAENLMIVDLLRNDLGRVCEPGSVHVPHLMEVESYATVHTMVSTIRGQKKSDLSPVDCIKAAFPGGSMTGAPKLRSMELLDSLESSSRGIYSGCIGFFSINNTFDLNIVIRTVVIHEGEASVGAGGAVVALSRPEEEYNEMVLKSRAPVNAVLECQRGFNSVE